MGQGGFSHRDQGMIPADTLAELQKIPGCTSANKKIHAHPERGKKPETSDIIMLLHREVENRTGEKTEASLENVHRDCGKIGAQIK